MNTALKIGLLVSTILIAVTICFPTYEFVRPHHQSGEILATREAGHAFIGSPPEIPSDGKSYYGTLTFDGFSLNRWSTRIDYARMAVYCALSVIVGVICGLLTTFRTSKKIRPL